MGFWQFMWVGLMALSLGVNLAQHGQPRKGKTSIWTALIAFAIQFAIVYFGGFFN